MSFSKAACLKLLREVTSAQVSIEHASAKILFWKKHAQEVVHYWDEVFRESSAQRKLDLVYVANDLLQKSRLTGKDFIEEFFKVLPTALKHLIKHSDSNTQRKIRRVVDIWRERQVFGVTATKTFLAVVANVERATPANTPAGNSAAVRPSTSASEAALLGASRNAAAATSTSESCSRNANAKMEAIAQPEPSQAALNEALKASRALAAARKSEAAAHQKAADAHAARSAQHAATARSCSQQLQKLHATVSQLEQALQAAALRPQHIEPADNSMGDYGELFTAAASPQQPHQYVPAVAHTHQPAHTHPPVHTHQQPVHRHQQPAHAYGANQSTAAHTHAAPPLPQQPPPEPYSPSGPPFGALQQAPGGSDEANADDIAEIANLVTTLDPNEAAALIFGAINDADVDIQKQFGDEMMMLMSTSDAPMTSQPFDFYDPTLS